MPARTIAFIDGQDDGHHLTYLRQYARALLELGHRVVLLLPAPDKVRDWFREQDGRVPADLFLHPFRAVPCPSPSWRLRRIWSPLAQWRAAARALLAAEAASGWRTDLACFGWLDAYILGVSPWCSLGVSALFPRPWTGLFFHPWHLRGPDAERDRHYTVSTAMLRTRRCRAVAVLDEGVVEPLQRLLDRPVIGLPDFTDERLPEGESEWRRSLRAAIGGRPVVGLVGELSRRKGVIPFLNAAARAQDRAWVFLLAGALGDVQRQSFAPAEWALVQRTLEHPPPNVLPLPGRIEDEREFNAVVGLCDTLYAAYENFGHSSGIVTKAAVFRKPILVAPRYCMAERVARYRLGLVCEPGASDEVIAALATLLDPDARARVLGEPDFAGCHRAHAAPALRAALAQLLAAA